MDIKKSLKDVIVLVAICAVFATVLAAVNSVTAPIIAERLEAAANEAYMVVMPGANGFKDFDISGKNLFPTVKEVKEETSGMGYAIKLETKGYDKGMILIVGVTTDGVVTGATCIDSNETNGDEKSYGNNFVGKDLAGAGAVDLISGSTMTTTAYRSAILDAINTVAILGGAQIDTRPEEVKFQDALEAALPGGKVFTKVVLLSALEGIDAVYEAEDGKGYVCLIGTDSTGIFLGVDADGKAVGEMSEEHKALAEAAIASVKANVAVDVDLTPYMDNSLIANYVNYVKKTGTGTYMIEIKTSGQYTANTPIVILVVIDADGRVIDSQTISHAETPSPGGAKLEDGALNSEFIGKNESECNENDYGDPTDSIIINGATFTSNAYKNAILNAFNVVKILSGESVDTRTEAEKFQDALEAALPGSEEFTKYFKVEIIEGFDSIYEAADGAGYVCVIGNDSTGIFIGVDASGVAVGEVSEEHKALAEAAAAKISATEYTDIDITEYKNSADRNTKIIFRSINSVKKTATGNYVIEIKASGYGSESMVVKVCIGSDGKILDAQTLSNTETPNIGGVQLVDGAFNSNFIGKNEAEAGEVDTVTGVTVTTSAFKQAITRCFTAVAIIEGGAN